MMSKSEVGLVAILGIGCVLHAIFIGFAWSSSPSGSFASFLATAFWAYPMAWVLLSTAAVLLMRIFDWMGKP